MTVSTTAVSVSYSGDGSTTAFPITFQFGTSADLSVALIDADGNETAQSLTAHYTVSQSASGTGTLTMLTAPASGYTLRIRRITAKTQPGSLRNMGSYYPETVEQMFDRNTRQIQEVQEATERSLRFPFGSNVDGELATPVAGGVPMVNDDEDGFSWALWGTNPEALASLSMGSGAALVGFKQSGTGAVARTMQDKARERYSILDVIPASEHAAIKAGTSTFNCAPYFQKAIDYCIQSGRELFLPAGTYILDGATEDAGGSGPVYLSNLTAAGQGLTMTGEGRGKTIIKAADGTSLRSWQAAGGGASNAGRFIKMFYFWFGASGTFPNVGAFTFRDITFDRNGLSNGNPVTESSGALGPFAWEQAHIIQWGTSGASCDEIGPITFERCDLRDKLGGGINFTSHTPKLGYTSIILSDCYANDHPAIDAGNVGERGDYEFGCDVLLCVMDKVTGRYSQIEPVTPSSADHVRRYKLSNVNIDTIQFTDTGDYSFLDAFNCNALTQLVVRGMHANIIGGRWRSDVVHHSPMMNVVGGTILLPYDPDTGVVTPFRFAAVSGSPPVRELKMTGTHIQIDSDDPLITPTGWGIDGGPAGGTMNSYTRTLTAVTFDSRLEGNINAYANGIWNLNGVVFNKRASGTKAALQVGASGSGTGRVAMNGCNFDNVPAGETWVWLQRGSTGFTLTVNGAYDAAKWKWNSTGVASLDTCILAHPTLWGTAAPSSGFWPRGGSVMNIAPSAGGVPGWMKVSTDSTAANWKAMANLAA